MSDPPRDSPKARGFAAGLLALLIACAAFLPGLTWGLPSRAVDPFLFGSRQPWSGAKIVELAPRDNGLGADVDANPILNRAQTVVLNQTDTDRAEIVRRYRLFSYQPDEMITFKSLSRIRENHGDPRLYQYGGLWIYPVGALIKIALNPKSDQAYYLDHPEAFGRFYVVARLYCVAWGLVATWALYWILRRMAADDYLAALGAMTFACMPVVINMAHEAKPHLPGLALTLLAVVAATKYVESGRERWAFLAGVLCGAAFAMVLSSLLAFAILPVMVMLRPQAWPRRVVILIESTALGVVTYVLFNPFVVINLLTNREVLRSNLGNSTAMYQINAGGFTNALWLIVISASPAIVVGAVIATLLFGWRTARTARVGAALYPGVESGRAVHLILAAPAILVLTQFLLLATNKPPEYARFALLIDVFLLITAVAAIAHLKSTRAKHILAMALLAFTLPFALPYVAGGIL